MPTPFRNPSRQSSEASARFLVVRHPSYRRHKMDVILEWAAANAPEIVDDFAYFDLGDAAPTRCDYRLCIFWLSDPIQHWCPKSYEQAVQLESWCRKNEIPMVNRPSCLANAGKSEAARRMRQVGLRTPQMIRLTDQDDVHSAAERIGYPVIIREDWGHGERMVRVDTPDELSRLQVEEFRRPVVVEWVDASDERGLCRKYRFQVAGTLGTPQHLQTSYEWLTRGAGRVNAQEIYDEEIAYLSRPDPNAALLHRACESLDLEFVAFDYGYDQSGQPVVWEANPFPYIHFSRGRSRLKYRNFAVHASLRSVLQSYYLQAGLDIPAALLSGLAERLPRLPHPWKWRYYRLRELAGSIRQSTMKSRSSQSSELPPPRPTQVAELASSLRDSK